MTDVYDNYFFFRDGPFAYWANTPFVINDRVFHTVEHYMEYKKAVLFGDVEAAEKILTSTNQTGWRKYGGRVKGFSIKAWRNVAQQYMYEANVAKFIQNADIQEKLISTGSKMLVSLRQNDGLWGIKMTEHEVRIMPPEQWHVRGRNWLGKTLVKVREYLINRKGQLQ